MDSALILKQKFDYGEIQNFSQASSFLNQSELIRKLLSDFDMDVLNLLNRLTEISEIPLTCHLEKVQNWVHQLADMSFCSEGFSITGKSDDILSCYNSMILTVLLRMNYSDKSKINAGINWILNYQNVQRGLESSWKGSRITKYGGCMKFTPCYIGIVKAMIALSEYKKNPDYAINDSVEKKLEDGLNYILDHELYKRKSNNQPITKDIDKLTYPFSYKTNLVEILRLMKDNKLIADSRCNSVKEHLLSKKQKTGYWHINNSYLPKCWIDFDKTKEPGFWISYEIEKILP